MVCVAINRQRDLSDYCFNVRNGHFWLLAQFCRECSKTKICFKQFLML